MHNSLWTKAAEQLVWMKQCKKISDLNQENGKQPGPAAHFSQKQREKKKKKKSWCLEHSPTCVRFQQISWNASQLVMTPSSLAVLCNLLRQLACPIKSRLQNQLDPGEQGVARRASVRQLVSVAARETDTSAPEYLYLRSRTSCRAFLRHKPTGTLTWRKPDKNVTRGVFFFVCFFLFLFVLPKKKKKTCLKRNKRFRGLRKIFKKKKLLQPFKC